MSTVLKMVENQSSDFPRSETAIQSVSIVIPVFNEQESLSELTQRTVIACERLACRFEIILVDDGSTDDSAALIFQASEQYPGLVRGIILNRNYGQHNAILAGFAEAGGDVVITLDADLQNPPEEIPRLVLAAEAVDVVGTVRLNRQDSPFRKTASAFTNQIIRLSTGVEMTDYGCMLRAYRRQIVDAMLQCNERSTFIPVLANSFAKSTTEITVQHSSRQAGESKYDIWKLIQLQFDLLTSMTTFPLRLLSVLGVLLSATGVAAGITLLVLRIFHGPEWAAHGVFTLFALLFTFVGLQFLGMGLIGEYIGRIYQDVRARPNYLVGERYGDTNLHETH